MNSVYNENTGIELDNWNFGAMICPFLWGLGNKIDLPLTLIALVSLCNPFTALLVCIWFGLNGNKWALEANRYESVDAFISIQKHWAAGILGLYIIFYAVFAVIYILG